jgi:hypothetical protein
MITFIFGRWIPSMVSRVKVTGVKIFLIFSWCHQCLIQIAKGGPLPLGLVRGHLCQGQGHECQK